MKTLFCILIVMAFLCQGCTPTTTAGNETPAIPQYAPLSRVHFPTYQPAKVIPVTGIEKTPPTVETPKFFSPVTPYGKVHFHAKGLQKTGIVPVTGANRVISKRPYKLMHWK